MKKTFSETIPGMYMPDMSVRSLRRTPEWYVRERSPYIRCVHA